MNITKNKLNNIFIYVFAFAPWIFTIALILFYFHSGFLLGKFPTYANPDPKDLFIYNFYGWIISPFLVISFITFFTWPIAFIIYVSTSRLYEWKKPLILLLIGHTTALFIFFSPIFEWYID